MNLVSQSFGEVKMYGFNCYRPRRNLIEGLMSTIVLDDSRTTFWKSIHPNPHTTL
jgi:hypothetical protein